jgi:hypothetical protein
MNYLYQTFHVLHMVSGLHHVPRASSRRLSRTSETSPVHRTVRQCHPPPVQTIPPSRSGSIARYRELPRPVCCYRPVMACRACFGEGGLGLGEFEAPGLRGLENSLDPRHHDMCYFRHQNVKTGKRGPGLPSSALPAVAAVLGSLVGPVTSVIGGFESRPVQLLEQVSNLSIRNTCASQSLLTLCSSRSRPGSLLKCNPPIEARFLRSSPIMLPALVVRGGAAQLA